jgi:hypothetical protein
MYSNSSHIARLAAMMMIRLLFRFNKSVMRSSLHALGDTLEIRTAFYDLLNQGKEMDIPMPIMNGFVDDIEKFSRGIA